MKSAILSLAAAYEKHLVPSQYARLSLLERLHASRSYSYLRKTTEFLNDSDSEDSFAVGMLLTHRAVVGWADPEVECWKMHVMLLKAYQRAGKSVNSPFNLFNIYQAILRGPIDPPGSYAHKGIGLDWLLECDDKRRILDVGLSRECLWMIGRTTELANATLNLDTMRNIADLIIGLQELTQHTTIQPGPAWTITMNIAESYRVSALIIAYCRLLG